MWENPDKSKSARILSFILLLAALAAIALYIRAHEDSFRAVSSLSIRDGAFLFVLGVFTIAVNGLFLKTFAAMYQVDLLTKEWFGLAAVTTMGNYLTPFSGGMIARAAYLNKRHNLSYSKFAMLLAANYLLVYLVIALAGIMLIFFSPSSAGYSRALLLFFAVVAGLILLLSKVKRIQMNVTNRYVDALNHALQGWAEIMKDRILVARILFLTTINVTAGALLFYIAFGALGFPVPFTTALLIYLITSFSLFINVTPGNFGVQEAVSSLAAAMLGAGADLGLMAALIIRVAMMAAAFTLGPLFGMLLAREMAENRTAGRTGGSR